MQRQAERTQAWARWKVPALLWSFLQLQLLRRLIHEPEGQGMQKPLERWPLSSRTSWPASLLPGWGPLLLSEGQERGGAAAWSRTQRKAAPLHSAELQLGLEAALKI